MPGIEVTGLSKRWGSVAAVDEVSFRVAPKTLTVLLGPSGCGKSTTLRLIAGIETSTSGSIRIGDRDVTHRPSAERSLSMVFQSYALFPHLSVAENIVFGLRVRRVPAQERTKRLKWASELLGLQDYLDRKPGQLSGGQQQRVALGRAIVAQAPVCLMDEPLSNLDAKLRHDMRKEIRSLQQRLGMTMLYVTHDQIEAMSIADQVILMRNGKIEQAATPGEMYARPLTTFAANFIGTPPMNLVPLEDGEGGAVIPGASGPALFAGAGRNRLLGIRPEHIELGGGAAMVEGRVVSSEYHGADTMISLQVGAHEIVVSVPGLVEVTPGETRPMRWKSQDLHLFDAASGQRIPKAQAGILSQGRAA